MSDKLYPIKIEHLAEWMLRGLEQDSLFGIPRPLWFEPHSRQPYRMKRYDQLLETPIGVAAGPHTQLSHNIIAAWLCGARYIELKTVQTLDNIEVIKPCIDMTDEGYNCEWSQELTLNQSFSEYLNAWILLHWLRRHLEWDRQPEAGFIFNMSVGYDLVGIRNANVQQFLDRMTHAGEWLEERVARLKPILPGIEEIHIPETITNNITLSTMHGCPPDEIERIARYLLRERQLHTTIKLNPTLLGPEKLPALLNEKLNFRNIRVPAEAFEHDLTYPAAVDLINVLEKEAHQAGVKFGVKLTNTLEVENLNPNLPDEASMLYLSGRALHPISVLVAERLQSDFDGALDISFSAGVDAFNVTEILACNIRPVTMCSDLLKPGGYTRLKQYLDTLDEKISASGAANIHEFILSASNGELDIPRAGLANLHAYAEAVIENNRYHQNPIASGTIKTNRALTPFDCNAAPCINECAVNQDIPSYMYHTARGDFDSALEVILRNNPFPHVAGLVCDHLCQTKCTRMNYDRPLLIRRIKHFIAQQGNGKSDPDVAEFNGKTVAIIGGGPAGLSAAYFLIQDGFEVESFESSDTVGGMTAHAIPPFRLDEAGLRSDVERIKRMG
ncbi:MAG: NAD(P)-binding protein, partial [Candidatus Marinimicrobia bacterium]|nr:NAD(P)-binding protein [Candidatus Neomarinimicrobiota bacterium]